MDELKRILPHVDYFMPSVAEAFTLSGTEDLAGAADFFLGLGARACIMKNGSKGAYFALGAERGVVPAHDIIPIDTTSCGDSYGAGFIAGLDRGMSAIDSCRLASAVDALVAQGLGALGLLRDFDHALATMAETPLRTTQ